MKKLIEYKLLITAILLVCIPLAIAGIQSEVGMYIWNSSTSKWIKQTGTLGGSFTVAGTKTPSDTYSNPTDGEDSLSFLMGWNGTNWDRLKTTTAGTDLTTGLLASALYAYDGTNFNRMRVAQQYGVTTSEPPLATVAMVMHTDSTWHSAMAGSADGIVATRLPASGTYGYNGTTWDRLVTAPPSTLSYTTGILGVAPMIRNGSSSYTQVRSSFDSAEGMGGGDIAISSLAYYNGSTYDRARSVGVGDDQTTGLPATGLYGYDGTNWDRAKIDANGSLYVNPGALSNTTDSITIYPPDPSYRHISTNTSTQVKASSGYLMGISINTAGASSNIATLYDNTSCATTVVAIIDTTAIGNVDYKGLKFTTGLCITTATGTAADLTVVYK